MFFSLFLSLSPFPSSRAKYGGTRVQPRVRKNDFENGGETARIHARESIVFLPGGARTIGTAARQTREGRGWFARPLRAAGKIGARTSARHISWFPVHLPSQSANAGRRGGQWETRNDREMQALPIVIDPVPCCPSDTGGGARFLSNFKHPWNTRRLKTEE